MGGDVQCDDEGFVRNLSNFDTDLNRQGNNELLDLPISDDEILKAINKLGSNKAPSIDNILYE
jgi:hypothetical protein